MTKLHHSSGGWLERRALLQLLLVATLPGAGRVRAAPPAGGAAAGAMPNRAVDIRNFAFVPAEITVPVGTRVVWTNRDDEAHVVVSTTGAFKQSPALDTDDQYALVFDKPGTYPYFCAVHPMMRGTVTVK